MNTICRVCEDTENLTNIFESDLDIVEKLTSCANIQINSGDDLPGFICESCLEYLNVAYQFKVQCEYTDNKLRDVLLKSKVHEEENENHVLKEDVAEYNFQELEIQDDVDDQIEYVIGHVREEDLIEEVEIYPESPIIDIINAENVLEEPESIDNVPIFNLESSEIISENGVDEEIKPQDFDEQELLISENLDSVNEELDDNSNKEEDFEEELSHTKKPKTSPFDRHFRCETCNQSFISYTDLNVHKKEHGDQRYQCSICSKWFSKKYRLKNHMTCHQKTKDYPCKLCDNKYTNQGNLDRHIRHFHKKERPYMCTECGLSFTRSSVLQIHMTTHSNERNYECDICHKKFKAQYYLKVHAKSHVPITQRRKKVKIKPDKKSDTQTSIVCNFCGKVSSSRTLHLSHIRVHTGEKPFECRTCGKRFAFRQSLKSHELLHTGEKPYICVLCGGAFRQVGHLKGHMLAHSGVKPFTCKFCDKSFTLKSNLVVHQRLHTGETPYHCDKCPKKFYDSNGLKRHKISQHSGKSAGDSKAKETKDVKEDMEAVEIVQTFFDEDGNYAEIIEMQVEDDMNTVDYSNINSDNNC